MLTEKEKKEMAQDAGWAEDKRIDDIKLSIRASQYDNDNEHAIKRKTLRTIIDHILYGKELDKAIIDEFIAYDVAIEHMKEISSN